MDLDEGVRMIIRRILALGTVALLLLAASLPATAHKAPRIKTTVTREYITAEADNFTKIGGRFVIVNRRLEPVRLRFLFKFVVEFVVPDELGFHRSYAQKRWSRGGPLEMPPRSFTRLPGLRITATRIDHPEIADLIAQYGADQVYRSDISIIIRHVHEV
jgi:hypothetical protein